MKKTLFTIIGTAFWLAQPAVALDTPTTSHTTPKTKGIDMTNTAEQPKKIEIVPGLFYEQTQAGSGDKPKKGDQVAVHYVGTLTDGTKFDSSRDRGEPIAFKLGVGQVIQGWDKGIMELNVGERGILTIAPELGYGEHGAGGVIPGGATLVFDVELISIN